MENMFEVEQEMQAFEDAMWKKYQDEEGKPVEPLCEGCHRTEQLCICGGVPDETPGWPPSAQETVHYQQIMSKPDEF